MVRLPSSCLRRSPLTYIAGIQGRRHILPAQARLPPWFRVQQQRCLHVDNETEDQTPSSSSSNEPPVNPQEDTTQTPVLDPKWAIFRDSYNFPRATLPSFYEDGADVVVHGFLSKRRDQSFQLSFCDLQTGTHDIQILSSWNETGSLQHQAHQNLKEIPAYSPVCVTGKLALSERPVSRIDQPHPISSKSWDLRLRTVQRLNTFPKNIIVSKDAVWSPRQRHLQLRFDPLLRQRLHFRAVIANVMRDYLKSRAFLEVETPILFKSTPEGAREFLVPTRRPGYAYALPQSPQQYKQILMAAGLPGYFQFAKCFRDEDHRADRQPEFTQLDIEMAFTCGRRHRRLITHLMNHVFSTLRNRFDPVKIKGSWHPLRKHGDRQHTKTKSSKSDDPNLEFTDETGPKPSEIKYLSYSQFPHMSYDFVMREFGTDKPDLRIVSTNASNITRLDFLPEDFIKKITDLDDPIIEAVKFRFDSGGYSPYESSDFIRNFMNALPNTPLKLAPGSTPGIFVIDSSQPLRGLSALGHEAGLQLLDLQLKNWDPCQDGDVVFIHARKNADFHGEGATDLGRLRTAVHNAAVEKGLIPDTHKFFPVWVYNFPMFTPNDGEEPGQGGSAGFSSTHHPFTAPLGPKDLELLRTDPLKAKADHYDLVINGVEVGGGSGRIHVAEVQEYVMRDVLGMTDQGVAQFAHLLEALRAGCPPHAGFAFGFDRLLTVLCDVPTVRDVIAFPKNNKGEDPFVGSPSPITPEQQKTYHLFRTE